MLVVSTQPDLFVTMSADPDSSTNSLATRNANAYVESYTTEIRQNDVLSGRGVPIINHPGNRRFRRLVLDRKREYASSCRHQFKNDIALQIIQTIRDEGGRFIKEVKTSAEATALGIPRGTKAWAFNDDKQIMQKVKQALREPDSNAVSNEEDVDVEGSHSISLENDQSHVDMPQIQRPHLNNNIDTLQAANSDSVFPGIQHINHSSAGFHQDIFSSQGNQRYLQEFLWLSQVGNNQGIIDMMRPHGNDAAAMSNISLFRQAGIHEQTFSHLGAPESIISTEMNAERVHGSSAYFAGQTAHAQYDQPGTDTVDVSQLSQPTSFGAGNDLRQLLRQSNSSSQLQMDESYRQSMLLNRSLPLPMPSPDLLTSPYAANLPYLLECRNQDQRVISEPQWSGYVDPSRSNINRNKRQLPKDENNDTFKQSEDTKFPSSNDKCYGKKPKK